MNCKVKDYYCDQQNFNEIDLRPSRTKFSMPSFCQLRDSSIFDNVYKDVLLNYTFSSADSNLFATAEVENDKMYKGHFNYQNFYWLNREEVNNWPDTKNTLLRDSSKNLNGVKIGYLKYLVNQKGKDYYEGRIFFIRDDKVTKLWFIEKFDKNTEKNRLMMDCVFESIRLY